MTREELIAHLEHLAEYVKYSEDAPALREVIEMLKCSEIPNSSKDFFWKNARKNARKYTETYACDLIERETARRIIDSPRSKEQMLRMLEATPPAQPEVRTQMSSADCISRKAAIDAVNAHYHDEYFNFYTVTEILKQLPSAQPEIIHCRECKYSDENWRRVSVKWLPCMDIRVPSNWFCGSAERREDG